METVCKDCKYLEQEKRFNDFWNSNCKDADSCCYYYCKMLFNYFTDTKVMLQILKDRGVISSWYYNGSYHIGNELPHNVDW